jgi:GTP pyrophosphokinase
MILTLNDDVRVILIKLADRLHNMQTMESMQEDKQTKIASETLYTLLALPDWVVQHKTKLEDLGLKYTEKQFTMTL